MWLTSQTGADVGSCDWVVGGNAGGTRHDSGKGAELL